MPKPTKTKTIKTQPIMLNYAANVFVALSLKDSDVGGAGLKTAQIEAEFREVTTRVAYSNTTPGLVVIHAHAGHVVDGPQSTVLGHLKFFKPGHNPSGATKEKLIKLIVETSKERGTSWSDQEIERDISHLLSAPVVLDDLPPAPRNRNVGLLDPQTGRVYR